MSTIYLVDANSVGYAGHHAVQLSSGDQPTQAVFNVLQNLKELKLRATDARILYLWDEKAQFRFDLLPEYKANRNDSEEKLKQKEEYHSQVPYIQRMLSMLGIPQLRHKGREADDIARHLSLAYAEKGNRVVLVSSDKDWLQMVAQHENISWYDPRFDRSCNHHTFAEFTGFNSAKTFIDSKCILGDKSDNIDGIPGLGEKACELMFARWDSVKAMIEEHEALGEFTKDNIGAEFSRYIKKLNAFCSDPALIKLYVRNRKLMDLAMAPPCNELIIDKGDKNSEDFFGLCEKLAFHSVLSKYDQYINTFFEEDAAYG